MSHYRDSPPTPKEVSKHVIGHGGLWAIYQPNRFASLVTFLHGCDTVVHEDGMQRLVSKMEGVLWRPCADDGTPVPWPEVGDG